MSSNGLNWYLCTNKSLLARAKAVIGSQWKVNSIATAFLFDEFYRQLETIAHKAVALQNVQNWLRRSTAVEPRERAKTWESILEPKEQFRLQRALKRLHDKHSTILIIGQHLY
ncbi:CHAT domain-containing protein [Scytonema sp. NUACC26]|uniref:CHAT domain-containing protein n=1 Tax=Scytonema sp. NUACC26 TaxID=3140176 RepID=UPI0038B39974